MPITIGRTSVQAGDSLVPSGTLNSEKFTAAATFNAITLFVYTKNTGWNIVLGIYDDVGGVAKNLLGQTAPIAAAGANQWHSADLVTPVPLVNGEDYWLAYHNDASFSYVTANEAGASLYRKWTVAYTGTFPDPFPAATAHSLDSFSIYAISPEAHGCRSYVPFVDKRAYVERRLRRAYAAHKDRRAYVEK